jgi:hypothetical protein
MDGHTFDAGQTMLRSPAHLMTPTKGQSIFGPTQNLVLRMLPPPELSALLSEASDVNLQPGTILSVEHEQPACVHFPMSGVVSLDIVMRNQHSVEAALVGHNSAVGLLGGLGIAYVRERAVVQAPGRAIKIPMKAFRAAARNPVIRDMVTKGVALLLWETQQNTMCSHGCADGSSVATTFATARPFRSHRISSRECSPCAAPRLRSQRARYRTPASFNIAGVSYRSWTAPGWSSDLASATRSLSTRSVSWWRASWT